MDDRAKTLIITISILIVILAIIFATLIYLFNFIRNKQAANKENAQVQTTQETTTPETSSAPQDSEEIILPETGTTLADYKIYKGDNFELKYPKSWGVLTCANSKHFEFDPENVTDHLGVKCDRAIKPITVLVNQSSCKGGNTVKLGTVNLTKVITETQTARVYEWCLENPKLEISHRVSPNPARATSKGDYSAQVEQMLLNSFSQSGTK